MRWSGVEGRGGGGVVRGSDVWYTAYQTAHAIL